MSGNTLGTKTATAGARGTMTLRMPLPTKHLVIADRRSLSLARTAQDLDEVSLHTAALKHRGLLPCALKYALWSVRPGGRVLIQDDGPSDPASPAFQVPFNNVRQWAVTFCARDARLVFGDTRTIEMTRTSPVLAPGWSAGIVFSGADEELPQLRACLVGLLLQPELDSRRGGEIVVCGPPRELSFLADFPGVNYLTHETPPGPRFLIGRKKNALIRALKGPRVVILHTRVVLEAGALAAVPREFDMSSPNTVVLESGRRIPYLSLCQTDAFLPGRMARRAGETTRSVPCADPLELHARGPVFVDGGAFFVTKAMHADCPLNEGIAWQEGEDVEWSMRAFVHGHLVDMAPSAGAVSATSKLRPLPTWVPAGSPFLRGFRWVRTKKSHLIHRGLLMMGGR